MRHSRTLPHVSTPKRSLRWGVKQKFALTVSINDAQSQIAHIFICQTHWFDVFICQKIFTYLGHIILKIYAQSWRNLKLNGNDVYSSGLASPYDIFFYKTNICAIWDCASCFNTVRLRDTYALHQPPNDRLLPSLRWCYICVWDPRSHSAMPYQPTSCSNASTFAVLVKFSIWWESERNYGRIIVLIGKTEIKLISII